MDLSEPRPKINDRCQAQMFAPANGKIPVHLCYDFSLRQYHINNTDSVSNIQKVDQIKDLGVLYDSHLTFQDHIQEKINKAYSMIGLIKRNFIHMDSRTFIMLYKALVMLSTLIQFGPLTKKEI